MHDELAERGRALVAAAPVHHEQPANVLELRDGEVRGQGGLPALLERAQGLPETLREDRRAQEGPAEPGLCLLEPGAVPMTLEGTG